MPDELYFDGDPAHESRRRHMERVIKGAPPRRRWPWIAALVLGGGAWGAWRIVHRQQAASAAPPTPSRDGDESA